MMRSRATFEALITGLRGGFPDVPTDWKSVIALANHSLLTPALFSSLSDAGHTNRLPMDVCEYLQFLFDCNHERNVRLRNQLSEAVAALNRCGITPLLIKGSIPLGYSLTGRIPVRMTSDIDICVEAPEETIACACLGEIGYIELPVIRNSARYRGAGRPRNLMRPTDVGLLDLHLSQAQNFELPDRVELNGLVAKIPPFRSRILSWIMHDFFKEGDYLRGRIDLRHIHDLARLSESDHVNWPELRASITDGRVLNALDLQLLALHDFFGVAIPTECKQRPNIRFHHWRRKFTATHPIIGAPVRTSGNLLWIASRLSDYGDLARRRPINLLRVFARMALDRDRRTKI